MSQIVFFESLYFQRKRRTITAVGITVEVALIDIAKTTVKDIKSLKKLLIIYTEVAVYRLAKKSKASLKLISFTNSISSIKCSTVCSNNDKLVCKNSSSEGGGSIKL